MSKTTQEVGSKKRKGQMQICTEHEPGALISKGRCESNSRIKHEYGNSATDCKEKFVNEKNFRKNNSAP
jgi:hypothetical protein